MPQGSTRISKALTNISVQYKNSEYISSMFMRPIPVMKESDQYWIYNREFRIPESKRANGSYSNMVTWEASTSSYVVTEHTLKDVVTDRDRMNTDAPLNLDRDTTEFLTDKILLRKEYEAAKVLFTTTTFSSNATLNTATSWKYNTTTSSPILNVLSATGAIIKGSGKRPNTMVLGWDSFEALKENPNMYDRIKYVERAIITDDLLAAIFDLQNVFVGSAVYQSNKEGETASDSFVWGSDALVAYFDQSPGLKKVTAAATFTVTEKGNPFKVKKWREEGIEGDYIEVQSMYQHKPIATSCAYLFKTVALS